VDRRKLTTSLTQEARTIGADPGQIKVTLDVLEELLVLCGEASDTRQMAFRIAQSLLRSGSRPTVLAPCCPDYSHHEGSYDFRSVRGGVSLLAQLHISFLESVAKLLPDMRVILLLADQEAADPELARACKVTPEEFCQLVGDSIVATQTLVEEHGWTVEPMTQAVPGFAEREQAVVARLEATPELEQRLRKETWQRSAMYQRTLRTAAQYVVLSEHAQANNSLICNHTTTNLAWYKDAGAAILHNPISIY
jgi:hypothetical protein